MIRLTNFLIGIDDNLLNISKLSSQNSHELLSSLWNILIPFSLKVVSAILIYIIGSWLIRRIRSIIKVVMEKKSVDQSLRGFLLSFATVAMQIFLVIVLISLLGVNTTSFAALIAAGGIAAGMALSGTLQNFAGGVMILLFKPFKVGDFIDAQGFMGTVKEIRITSTLLNTPDNKMIIMPNGSLSNGIINNFSNTGVRRVEWKVSISYGDDIDLAKSIILEMLNTDERVLREPAEPFSSLLEMGDSSIVVVARAWVKTEDFWSLYFEINEKIYKTFPNKGLTFPFPQLDVTIKNRS